MQTAVAGHCDGYMSNLEFGTVDLLHSAVVDASAPLHYGCSGSPGENILVCVGMSPNPANPGAGAFDPRYLKYDSGSPAAYMAFNLYTDPARTDLWGDFGASSYPPTAFVLSFGPNEYYLSGQRLLYGRIKTQGQAGLPAGLFNTTAIGNWPMTIKYLSFAGANPPSCYSGGMSALSRPFYISANVKSDCRIDVVSLLDFGTVFQTIDRNIDSTATITVTCTGGRSGSGGVYHVMLDDGQHAVGQQRRQQGPDGSLLKYELYRDAARAQRWGNTQSTGLSRTGDGTPQQLTVYGRVPPQSVATPGTYRDTVLVTVSY